MRASWQAAARPGSALEPGPLDGVVLEALASKGREAVERPVFRQHSQGAGWLSSRA